ncbi:MAG: AhpC/TSA family protein [Planctomycetes bacterium]|nr:AhpC/TSA family protein [Planctomycetota bacterium]
MLTHDPREGAGGRGREEPGRALSGPGPGAPSHEVVARNPAPELEARDHEGRLVRLGELQGPRWLAFFRYASCPLCNLRVRGMIVRHEELAARGLSVVAVFQSPPASIARAVGAQRPPFPLVADPQEALYRLYGLEARLGALLAPANLGALGAALARGFLPGRPEGSITRVPGDFLIRADGVIDQAFYGRTIAEHIPFEAVDDFLRRCAG